MRYIITFFIVLLPVLSFAIDVSGSVSGTWTTSDSPVRIIGDVTVDAGNTLTVNPGVIVNYTGNYSLTINGTLLAQGTLSDSIIFKHETNGSTHLGIDFVGSSGSSIMEYCRIQDGDAGSGNGGGILIDNASPIIRHCTITNNSARYGGGIFLYHTTSATIESNVISNNTSNYLGGGIGCNGSSSSYTNTPEIINNIIFNNTSTNSGGGGISFYRYTTTTLLNNVIYNNQSSTGGGGLVIYSSNNNVTVRNCVFWNNSAGSGNNEIDPTSYSADLTVEYTDVEGGYTGSGNINSDPLFVNVNNYDFHLNAGSPCIDTGISTSAPSTDFDGNATGQDGNNSGTSEYDMGAFEFLQDVNTFSSSSSADYFSDTFESGTTNQIAAIAVNGVTSGSSTIAVNCYTKSNTPFAPAASKSIRRWYAISVTGNLLYADADLRLYFSDTQENLDNLTVANLRLWHYNGSTWENVSGTVATGTNWVELSGVSPSDLQGLWAFSDPNDNPLPVELTSFTAMAGDEIVTLKWETASEINNMGYVVYRSSSKVSDYEEISSYKYNHDLKGAGTTSNKTRYEYSDRQVINGQTYWYKISDVDLNGNRTFYGPIMAVPQKVEIEIIGGHLPVSYSLSQNYPNPFNPTTKIHFDIPENKDGISTVQLNIYNMLGKKVKTLYNGQIAAGSYEIEWAGKNDMDMQLPSGIYIYQLISPRINITKKMMLIK